MISSAGKAALYRGGGVAALTFAGLELFDLVLDHFRKEKGLPPLPADESLTGAKVGGTLTLSGLLVDSKNSDVVAGVGAGLALRSASSAWRAYNPPTRKLKAVTVTDTEAGDDDEESEGTDLEEGDTEAEAPADDDTERPVATIHELPDAPWNLKYGAIARIFQRMMNDDGKDARGRDLPAARWHPEVVQYARQILDEYGIDGKDPAKVIRAVWQHFRENYTPRYSFDPKKGDSDFFVAPHLFLRSFGEGGYGKVGDCDDAAAAISAVLLALGIPSAMVMVQQPGKGYYNHVFPAALLDANRYANLVPPDPKYRVRMPSGQEAVMVPMEHTVPRPWMYHPRFSRRGIIFFDNNL